MCGRFTLHSQPHEVAKQFQLAQLPLFEPRYNIAPTQQVPVVRLDAQERRSFDLLRWGLVPSWAEDVSIGSRMINARAETVAEKPSFRKAFAARRCLIVADGFYEWHGQGKSKHPYYITLQNGGPFAFAGLWEMNKKCAAKVAGDETAMATAPSAALETCTIITTTANELMAKLHHRMPVILPVEHYDLWLDPAAQEPERLLPLLAPFPSKEMRAVPVSTHVNNPRNEDAGCLVPLPS
jgi:putative SOS response-associated peptidase YedK